MFGWEFPPFISGGLGTACYGLTKGLTSHDVNVTFVLPKSNKSTDGYSGHVNMLIAGNIELDDEKLKIIQLNSVLVPYISSEQYDEIIKSAKRIKQAEMNAADAVYGKNLFEEVHRYAEKAKIIAEIENFDLIHAHDWMTYPAAIQAKKATKKPLVVHIHATEFDRTGGHPNQHVYDIERQGFHVADHIIAVSNFTKSMLTKHYAVPPDKVSVVHNGIDLGQKKNFNINKNENIVLFLGRITLQKGPEYFLYAAKRVLEKEDNVKFVVAGSGDMEKRMIELSAELGIAKNVLFTGFLRGDDIDRVYSMADLYVMPSVSEPFGITPLEAIKNNTPVLISKTSGVSEVINHCLKVDFWDIDQMSNKIIATLRYKELQEEMVKNSSNEIRNLTWENAARKCINIYNKLLNQ